MEEAVDKGLLNTIKNLLDEGALVDEKIDRYGMYS